MPPPPFFCNQQHLQTPELNIGITSNNPTTLTHDRRTTKPDPLCKHKCTSCQLHTRCRKLSFVAFLTTCMYPPSLGITEVINIFKVAPAPSEVFVALASPLEGSTSLSKSADSRSLHPSQQNRSFRLARCKYLLSPPLCDSCFHLPSPPPVRNVAVPTPLPRHVVPSSTAAAQVFRTVLGVSLRRLLRDSLCPDVGGNLLTASWDDRRLRSVAAPTRLLLPFLLLVGAN